MAKPKWIIFEEEDGEMTFISGRVDFHMDLVKPEERKQIKGGGWWHPNPKLKSLFLFSSSVDFGYASEENVIKAVQEGLLSRRLNDWSIYFSHWGDLSKLMDDFEKQEGEWEFRFKLIKEPGQNTIG